MSFDVAFTETIGLEGRFSDDERDPGNWTSGQVDVGKLVGTMYGISAAAYPTVDIPNLTLIQAKEIYARDYWSKNHCDALPDALGVALFKESVNLGVDGAAKALQRSLKCPADGKIGSYTIGLATSIPVAEALTQFLTECAYDYTQMDNFKVDGRGWLSRVIKTALQAKLA